MGVDENKAAVRRLFAEVLIRGDQAARRELIHPDFVGVHAPGGTFISPGGTSTRGGGSSFREAFPDGTQTIDLLIAEGDYVTARWTFSGTHTGVFDNQMLGRFPPTGRRIIDRGVNIYRFQDGKIIENWLHRDELQFIRQLRGDTAGEQP